MRMNGIATDDIFAEAFALQCARITMIAINQGGSGQ
jgi:formylmethanofuran:tetrahydromethanopterin formyltransferase